MQVRKICINFAAEKNKKTMALTASSSYKESEIAEIQAELGRIREKTPPSNGGFIKVTGRNYRTGVEVTVGNDGEAFYVNMRDDKRTGGVLLARIGYTGNKDRSQVFKQTIRKATAEILKYSPKR